MEHSVNYNTEYARSKMIEEFNKEYKQRPAREIKVCSDGRSVNPEPVAEREKVG